MNKKFFSFLKFIPFEIFENSAVRLFNGISKFIINYLLALLCGPIGKGIIAFAELIFMLLYNISNFSIFKTIPHYLFSDNFKYSKKTLLNAIIILQLFIAFIFISIFFFLFFKFNNFFNDLPFLLIFLFIFMVPIKIIFETIIFFLQCLKEIRKVNFLISIRNLFILLIFIIFILFDLKLTIYKIAYIYFFSFIILLFVTFIFFKKTIIIENSSKINFPDKKLYQLLFKSGAAIHPGYIFAFLFFYVDQFMLKYFCNLSELGFYSFSVNIFTGLLIFAEAVQFVLVSNLSVAVNDKKYLLKKFIEALILSFFVSLISSIIIYFIAPIFFRLFLPQFFYSLNSLFFLLPGLIFFSMSLQCSSYLITNGFFLSLSFINFFVFISNIFLNYLFIPKFLSAGAAIASSFSYFLLFVFYIFVIIKSNIRF
ncbi:MAG TPA: hypothetical protein PLD27_11295 [bacterium]|nr:hypothetical protein [bacterium]HPQ19813.1 hypothetical protein [bacterium]